MTTLWMRKVAPLAIAPLLLVLASCSSPEVENQPSKTVIDMPSESDQSPAATAKQVQYKVESFIANGTKQDLPEGAGLMLPDPAVGGTIVAIGFCSNPAFQIESVNGQGWSVVPSETQAGSGCTESTGIVTGHLAELFTGTVAAASSGSTLIISRSDDRLELSK